VHTDQPLDPLFEAAVAAMDAGDLPALERMLTEHPRLVVERLRTPGNWLREKVGKSLEGFFRAPYLLWFVAEDPVRNGRLPPNIAAIAAAIVEAARRERVQTLREQLDYALSLVSWSWIARECGVQLDLIDVLVDAGASPDGNPENALVNGNVAAAEHLVERGARLTLATALCLRRWDEADRVGLEATPAEKQFALTLAALRGQPEAVRRAVALGADPGRPSADLYSHAPPLHHAVSSGDLESVRTLVEAGADVAARDEAWGATPFGWADHFGQSHPGDERAPRYAAIAEYLRKAGSPA
jgi:hypothetical protein